MSNYKDMADLELDEASMAILERFSAEFRLPKEGILILALADVAQEDGESLEELGMMGISGEQFLTNLIDEYEKSPPKTEEEHKEFVEHLRYAAQFMTTRTI